MIKFDILDTNHGRAIQFDYVNWKGEKAQRKAELIKITYSSNEWHTEEQWLVVANDLDKNELRTFAMKDMSNIKYLN